MVNAIQELSDENQSLKSALENEQLSNPKLAVKNEVILSRLAKIEKKLGLDSYLDSNE